ncbi:MAG TPA: D-alanine--D-alanine ligase [Oligoflexia bacterium]|nr:D-alanine--D-alanine ligase [Oligoflexia bacterium]
MQQKKAKLRVGILFGGKSGEHEVSVTSALSIFQALDKEKYEVTLVGIDKTGRWLLPEQAHVLAHQKNPRLLKLNEVRETVGFLPFPAEKNLVPFEGGKLNAGSASQFDVVFPVLHGTNGEDGTMQGLLELANVAYVGSGVLGSSVGMDKDVSKRLFRDAGIPVVPYLMLHRHEYRASQEMAIEEAQRKFGYPYFVKPANLGSSVGVGKVKNKTDAIAKIEDAFQYDTKILIEQAIDARELECAVLGNHQPEASVVGEIIPLHEFYSYEAKYIDAQGADLRIPAENLSREIEERVRTLAVQGFKALECSGLARVDFFLDRKTGKIFLNEINTIPGFTSISMYPKLWEATGMPYSKLLDRLIHLALERFEEKRGLKTTYESQ